MANAAPLLWQAMAKIGWANMSLTVTRGYLEKYLANGGIKAEIVKHNETDELAFAVVAYDLPLDIALSLGMAVHSLRSALDAAVSTLMQRAGSKSGRTNFPIHQTERALRATFDDGIRTCPDCKQSRTNSGLNAPIRKLLPDLETLIFDEFKPWEGGSYALWALSRLDNIDKHRMILPTYATANWKGGEFWTKSTGGGALWSVGSSYSVSPGSMYILAHHVEQHEIITPGVFDTSLEFPLYVSAEVPFPEPLPFGGKACVETLEEVAKLVTGVVETLEAHFQRG
jgi:hypothetical protein